MWLEKFLIRSFREVQTIPSATIQILELISKNGWAIGHVIILELRQRKYLHPQLQKESNFGGERVESQLSFLHAGLNALQTCSSQDAEQLIPKMKGPDQDGDWEVENILEVRKINSRFFEEFGSLSYGSNSIDHEPEVMHAGQTIEK